MQGRAIRIAALALLPAWLAGAAPPPLPALRWERAALPQPGDVVGALALDEPRGRLALGGERGVQVVGGERATSLTRGAVRDLAFLPDGALLVATDDGLYRLDPDGRYVQEALGPSRRVVRVAVGAGGLAAAATDAGVLLRDRAGRWARRAELPRDAASLVALRARGADVELWCVVAGELWVSAFSDTAPEGSLFATRVSLPESGNAALPIDVAFDLPEADVAFVTESGFAVRGAEGAWRMLRASWPPGALPLHLGVARGLRALATTAGLLLAPELAGPWQRASLPAGGEPALALAASGREIVVATHREVLRADGEIPPTGPSAPAPLPPLGPDILAVQRAALAYLELEPRFADSLRARAHRSAWLPIVAFRVGHEQGRGESHDWDQSFISGATHDLYDEGRDRSDDLELELTVSWNLGETVFNPDEVDVSRELRSVIALRDDVLDELNQLYFERRRALEQLAHLPAADPEADTLRLRSAELAAGIDAWTGGWFTRALRGPDTPRNGESR